MPYQNAGWKTILDLIHYLHKVEDQIDHGQLTEDRSFELAKGEITRWVVDQASREGYKTIFEEDHRPDPDFPECTYRHRSQ